MRPARAIDGRMYRLAARFLLFLALATPTEAQGPFGTSPYQPPVDDKTGTNPLNLQQQIDISNVYLTLDPLYLNSTTYRHAVALFHRRLRLAGLLPIGVSNLTGTKEWGIGDVGADVEWTPWLAKGTGLIAGLRTTWNTATAAGLGYGGTHTLMPYAQYVRQTSPRLLLAPFFGYRFGVTGEDFAPDLQGLAHRGNGRMASRPIGRGLRPRHRSCSTWSTIGRTEMSAARLA